MILLAGLFMRLQTKSLPLADDVNLEDLATSCHGYTGADLEAVCREAALARLVACMEHHSGSANGE